MSYLPRSHQEKCNHESQRSTNLRSVSFAGGLPRTTFLERAVLLGKDDTITPKTTVIGRRDTPGSGTSQDFTLPADRLDPGEIENDLNRQALARTKNDPTHAAKLLYLS